MRGFIIQVDHLSAGEKHDRTGRIVSFDDQPITPEAAARFPVRFKAFDDDGELYYEGRCTDDESDPRNPGFEDVWLAYQWMQNDAGVTSLMIREGNKPESEYP